MEFRAEATSNPVVEIDLRPRSAWLANRSTVSYSFPAVEMCQRANELPAKDAARLLCIVTSDAIVEQWRCISSAPDGESERFDGKEAELRCLLFLRSGKWSIHDVVSFDSYRDVAPSNQMESGADVGSAAVWPSRRCWSPSPFLEAYIDHIEHSIGGPGVAFDVGCGSGRDIAFLAARGWHVFGIDNRDKLLQQAAMFTERYASGSLVRSGVVAGGCHPMDMTLKSSLPLRPSSVDLLLIVRFIHRPLFDAAHEPLVNVIRNGGFVLYSHFVDGVQHSPIGHPKHPDAYLQHGELRRVFCDGSLKLSATNTPAKAPTDVKRLVEVVVDEEALLADGRPVANFLAKVVHEHPSA